MTHLDDFDEGADGREEWGSSEFAGASLQQLESAHLIRIHSFENDFQKGLVEVTVATQRLQHVYHRTETVHVRALEEEEDKLKGGRERV